MKKTFPGHFPPTNKEVGRLWESCMFTLDTNILLNLYRYSDATRNEFIRVLKAIKDRLWLPHRVAQEYFENRLIVVSQQEKAYDEAIKTIKTLQANLSNARQHPFLSDKLMQKLTQLLGDVVVELTSTRTTHANRTSSDEIQKAIGDLFNGRVGPPYSEEQLETMCKEGEDRYVRKVPPGYMDDVKDEPNLSIAANYRKYGDLIIWRQIIEHSTKVKKGLIFINDDKKEDWWLISHGKTIGPRPELIEEFLYKTGQSFHMYQADRFLEYAADFFKQTIAQESMDEIRDLRKLDMNQAAAMLARRKEEAMLREEELRLQAKASEALLSLEYTRKRMADLRDKESKIQHGKAVYQENLDRSGGKDHESLERLIDLTAQAAAIEMEIAKYQDKIMDIEQAHVVARNKIAHMQRIIE